MQKFQYMVDAMPLIEVAHPQQLVDYLNHMGLEGWKLTTSMQHGEIRLFIFVRGI